jgi:hypothetical protein
MQSWTRSDLQSTMLRYASYSKPWEAIPRTGGGFAAEGKRERSSRSSDGT